jgi:tRNA-splicing ligase RtcB
MITGKDLIEMGFKPSNRFKDIIAEANLCMETGKSWEITKSHLFEKFKEIPKLELRQTPLKIAVACNPETEEEAKNAAASIQKMEELSRVPIVEACALMPDNCPAGNEWGSIPVGGAIQTENAIIPAAHSADLFCSMSTTLFECHLDAKTLMAHIAEKTHFGPYPAPVSERRHDPILDEPVWDNPFLKGLETTALDYLGTQGDGNHFSSLGKIEVTPAFITQLEKAGKIELAKSLHAHKNKVVYALTTHHGSRNFGAKVYKRGLETAEKETALIANKIPRTGAWLDTTTPIGTAYLEALKYVGRWTKANHNRVHQNVLNNLDIQILTNFGNEHNAIWEKDGKILHGKGATPAWKENGLPQLGIIPLNMGKEILIVLGNDNPTFLGFAPHGAGRNRSRTETLKPFLNAQGKPDRTKIEESIQKETQGLHIHWKSGKSDISESPLGYKNPQKVKEEIERFGLATIIQEIRPQGCIMAGEMENLHKKKKKTVEEPNLQ